MNQVQFDMQLMSLEAIPHLYQRLSPSFRTSVHQTWIQYTVKPRYSAPAFNIIPPIKHTNFSAKKCFYSYSYVGHKKILSTVESMILTSPLKYAIAGFNCK